VSVQASSYRFDNLNSAKDYAVRIKVNNLVDESDLTYQVKARTGIVPMRPDLLTFVATTRTTISLSFKKLVGSDTGGTDLQPLEITYYHILMDNGMGGEFTLLTSLLGTENTYIV